MKKEYKRDMNHNYLILHGDSEIDTASYQVRMLVGNVIPSLLKCRIQGMDGKFMVYYDITSRQSLSAFYENKKLRKEEVKLIFTAFIRVMEDTAEYLMDPGQLIISPDLIFLEADKKELYFCLMPGYQKDIREQLQILAEYILPKIDHGDGEAVSLGYGIYRRTLEDSFHLEHIKEELYRGRSEEKASVVGDNQDFFMTEEKNRADFGEGNDWEDGMLWEDRKEGLTFAREGAYGDENSNSRGKKAGKAILSGILFIMITGGIIAAKILGYLPQIGMEMILGAMISGTGVGMLVYLGVKKVKDSRWNKDRKYDSESKAERSMNQEKMPMTGKRNGKEIRKETRKDAKKETGKESRKDTKKDTIKDPRKDNGNRRNERNWKQADSRKKGIQRECGNRKAEGRKENDSWKEYNWDENDGEKEMYYRKTAAEEEHIFPEKGEYFGETMVLSAATAPGPASLVSHEPGELASIYLREDITVIGKLENACDAVIDLPTVSRIHAKIRKRDNEYYLTDLNSRNGTSVNGRLLRPDEDYKLENEDEVDFAQARYIFVSEQ